MITAEQARKNVEHHNARVAEAKRQSAMSFIEKVIDPKIIEASTDGKCDISVDITKCSEVASNILGILHEAGFKTEHTRNDSVIQISWGTCKAAPPETTAKAVVVIR